MTQRVKGCFGWSEGCIIKPINGYVILGAPCGRQKGIDALLKNSPPDCFYLRSERPCAESGFYGVLKPLDGVTPYRLEMQAKASVNGFRNLYDFWGDSLYREVLPEDRIIINLASKEYSKCVEKYLQPQDTY